LAILQIAAKSYPNLNNKKLQQNNNKFCKYVPKLNAKQQNNK